MRIFRTIDIDEKLKTREREKLNRQRKAEHIGIYPNAHERHAMRKALEIPSGDDAKRIVRNAMAKGSIVAPKKRGEVLADLRREGIIP